MTDEQRLEFAHRIVGCMVPGCNDLALQAIREIEAAEREACAVYAEAILEQGTGYHPGCPNTLAESIHEDTCKRIIAAIRARGAEGKESK